MGERQEAFGNKCLFRLLLIALLLITRICRSSRFSRFDVMSTDDAINSSKAMNALAFLAFYALRYALNRLFLSEAPTSEALTSDLWLLLTSDFYVSD